MCEPARLHEIKESCTHKSATTALETNIGGKLKIVTNISAVYCHPSAVSGRFAATRMGGSGFLAGLLDIAPLSLSRLCSTLCNILSARSSACRPALRYSSRLSSSAASWTFRCDARFSRPALRPLDIARVGVGERRSPSKLAEPPWNVRGRERALGARSGRARAWPLVPPGSSATSARSGGSYPPPRAPRSHLKTRRGLAR